MSRPVTLHLQPPFFPKVCIRCGCGTGQREFFVDLGINLTGYFNPMNEGDIYYCDQCVRNLVVDINRLLAKREAETAPWVGVNRADVTYSWQEEIDLSVVEAEVERVRANEQSYPNSESDDSGVEQVVGTATNTVELPESTVSTIFSDDESESIGFSFDDS